MSISAIGSPASSAPAQAVRRNPEAAEVKRAGPDNDGDGDDMKAAKPAPSVNLNGQTTGQIIHVTA